MPSPALAALLILQDRDTKRADIELHLKAMPVEVASVERGIAAEKAALEAAKSELRELETKKKLLETEIGSAEDKLGRYKTQQMAVRKNDEFQALGHEIETVQGQIGELESEELKQMYAIDDARKRLSSAEAATKKAIEAHQARIGVLKEKEGQLAKQLVEAREQVAAARGAVAAPALRVYDGLIGKGLPVVVAIRGGKCGGCHLKVSSDADSASRGKGPDKELAQCDQCGRIIYWESN